jgi:predicted RNase H-like HicB family nuclease
MLTDYIQRAMAKAHYELMENGRYFASIPGFDGVWAQAKTLETCRTELQNTLEDWLLLGLQLGHKLPVVGGVNLNRPIAKRASRSLAHA